MRTHLIPWWIIASVAVVIAITIMILLVGVIPGLQRFEELRECDRTRGTPEYNFEVCGGL
jgi:membrane protein YdbS with pleckstrin-like domain